MTLRLRSFLAEEDAAVTTDMVVLVAVIIAMTLGVFVIITEMIYTEAGTRIGDLIMGLLD
ncbi:hypothetical protein KM031_03115 [Gemmobacter fulvus]|uniref:Uncharacterized protein n=1 Tax=Gemmobacter fulvus TaxID=2840474 RepID=A0A975P7A1_9RHOB|nr:hypothetical protein [Gemmobacter fulvus]MBT9244004.1 hypothetical protein [Gemmobacter fulvus]MDQ1849216.1 hypothetical protein [Gemmobacter fulvus]QWK90915.1 hypothetical protein KM031_03115 [Gemmobacter fulvus]